MHTIKIKRKITSANLRISELKDFIGKDVEITVRESNAENILSTNKPARGILSEFKKTVKIGEEKNAWKLAITKKYGNS